MVEMNETLVKVDSLNNIPHGWLRTTIGELADYINGRAFKPAEWKDTGLPIVRIQNLNDKTAKYNYSPEQHEKKYLIENGDLLFAWSASLGAHIWHGGDAWLNQHIFRVLPQKHTTKLFVFYLLKKVTTELYAKAHGSGMVHVTKGKFEETEVLLPPLNEQKRIVAKIEELFTELDAGIANLRLAQAQLKTYRQALLKHAFEGQLTAAWREAHADQLEPATTLLQRIQNERQARYAAALETWEKGEEGRGRKPSPPQSLPPLTPSDLAALPQLPFGWAWLRLGNLNLTVSDGPFGSSLKTSDYVDQGVRVIRLENVGELEFIHEKESYISEEKYESLKKHTVTSGDIIFASFITEATRVIVLPPSVKRAINKADCFLVRLQDDSTQNDFLAMFLSTRLVFKQLEALVHGVGRPRINTTQLKEVAVPVCGHLEQLQIIREVKSGLSVIDQLEQTIITAIQQSEALRQSILKKAFAGQLVPQDPHDEPASALLTRIRAQQVPGKGQHNNL
jgi:type I restriction enzyme S subunit